MKWIGISNCATRRRHSRFRGYTLTEIAIVLGVIGAIVGSVWVLAAQSWENARQEELRDEISSVVRNVRANAAGQTGISGTFTTLTPVLINSNVIPGDMVRRPPNAGGCTNVPGNVCADNPWGATTVGLAATGSFGVCGWQYATTTNCTGGAGAAVVAGAAQQFFGLELQGLSQENCIKAAILNSSSTAPAGLYDVYINGTSIINGGGITNQLPPLASDAKNLCARTVPATVDFIYRVVAPQS